MMDYADKRFLRAQRRQYRYHRKIAEGGSFGLITFVLTFVFGEAVVIVFLAWAWLKIRSHF